VKYPWLGPYRFIIEARGSQNATMSKRFTREIFDNNLKKLARGKTLGPNNIPNKILKILPGICSSYFPTMLSPKEHLMLLEAQQNHIKV
jgi:hypothetical protein